MSGSHPGAVSPGIYPRPAQVNHLDLPGGIPGPVLGADPMARELRTFAVSNQPALPSLSVPKRLAITISGAVSLGSYEAGVLYEVIHAVGCHNTDPATLEPERIEIDVITGASAGGMTAAIAVQKLLFEAGSLADPYDNSFYRPWVREVSLERLMKLAAGENSTHSILSSSLVEAIASRHLTGRYAGGAPPPGVRHPAAAASIRLGLALSNLNGVSYQRAIRPAGSFAYSCYQDQMSRRFDSARPADDSVEVWEQFRQAVVACGAFPFAFRTKDLTRRQSEYTDPYGIGETDPALVPCPAETQTFTYTDGGVFQNEPLGLAKNLVDVIDPDHTMAEQRFYLFVAPGARAGTASAEFRESVANFGATARQLMDSIFNQARFHDWIQAEHLNEKVRLFNSRATELHKLLRDRTISAADLRAGATSLLHALLPDADERQRQQERVQSQWHLEYAELAAATDEQTARTWIDSILTFEVAADLTDKDEMVIYGITAGDAELAGAGVESFLGFFDQAYRDHDYDVGRTKARDILDRINKSGEPLGPIRCGERAPIREIDHSLDGLKLKDVPRAQRQDFKDRLTARAHDFMAEIGIPTPVLRQIIDTAFISPQLNKLLGL